jgi:hypothetical protein
MRNLQEWCTVILENLCGKGFPGFLSERSRR